VDGDDGPETGLEPDCADAGQQRETRDDAGQRDRQNEQERDRLLAGKLPPRHRKCSQGAEDDREPGGNRRDERTAAAAQMSQREGDLEPVQRESRRRELVGAVLGRERIEHDHPHGRV
jgi:hypothetical protein